MPQWLRNLTMLVVIAAWLAVVAVSLLRGELPGAPVLGIPAALVIALAPPGVLSGKRPRRRKPRQDDSDEDDT
jgi:hypothetical protein